MSLKSGKSPSEKAVREIKRRTRRKFSIEEKIRIVLEGLRGEISVAELCRKEDIKQFWNRIPDPERERVRDLALQQPEMTPREYLYLWELMEDTAYSPSGKTNSREKEQKQKQAEFLRVECPV